VNNSRSIAIVVACVGLLTGGPGLAASDYYLHIEGIEGESATRASAEPVAVLSFSWGASNPPTVRSAGSKGTGKMSVQDPAVEGATPAPDAVRTLTVVIPAPGNATSGRLLGACASGKHIDKVVLRGRDESYELNDAVVTSCDESSAQFAFTIRTKHVKTGHVTLIK
jgi:type VI protein secretion system component Hcp